MNKLPPGMNGTQYGSGWLFLCNSMLASLRRRMALASLAVLPSSKRARSLSASSRKISRSIAQDERTLRDFR